MGLDKVQEQQAITSAKRAVELWLKKDHESLFDYLSTAANFFRKDYVNGVWTRYPCGVACGAGELVEQEKPLEGGQWATSALYLRGISLMRRNDEWHHFDPLGTAGVITNGSASVISNNLYDLFGVLRYEQGSAQTPWRWASRRLGEEGTYRGCRAEYIPTIGISSLAKPSLPPNVIMIHCLRGKISNCKLVQEQPAKGLCPDPKKSKLLPDSIDYCKGCIGGPKNCRKVGKILRFRFEMRFLIVSCTYECTFEGEECECLVEAEPVTTAPASSAQ